MRNWEYKLTGIGSSNWTPENVLKGRMAEALVDELLRSTGNKVCRFGYETVLQNLTQIERAFDGESQIGRQIKSIPDFVVLNEAGKPFFVEVKFRFSPQLHLDEFSSLLKKIEKFWRAKVILVTPQKPYFRIGNPPYFDHEGNLVFKNLEDDYDLNVTSRSLKEFDPLVEKYFAKETNWVAAGK